MDDTIQKIRIMQLDISLTAKEAELSQKIFANGADNLSGIYKWFFFTEVQLNVCLERV